MTEVWLSEGEYVISADAARSYHLLHLLETLNAPPSETELP